MEIVSIKQYFFRGGEAKNLREKKCPLKICIKENETRNWNFPCHAFDVKASHALLIYFNEMILSQDVAFISWFFLKN